MIPERAVSNDIQQLPQSALVIGEGLSGLMAAKALGDLGVAVTIVGDGELSFLYETAPHNVIAIRERLLVSLDEKYERFPRSDLTSLSRHGECFIGVIRGEQRVFQCVFLTGAPTVLPTLPDVPCGVHALMPGPLPVTPGRVTFVLDYGEKSPTAVGMTAMAQAIENQENGGESYVLMAHAPVNAWGGEELYERAKSTGVRFIRFGDDFPHISRRAEQDSLTGEFVITLRDRIDPSETIVVACDHVFLAMRASARSLPPALIHLAEGEVDEEGWLLSSRVHCGLGNSFRNGVFAIGEVTGEIDVLRTWQQVCSAALGACEWINRVQTQPPSRLSVGATCIRCLTCSRICPHGAITLQGAPSQSRIQISTVGCQECGLCLSECPRQAITFHPNTTGETDLFGFLELVAQVRPSRPIIVFGCKRSAGRMVEQIESMPDVVFCAVQCAGRVSESLLWEALTTVAKGILVAGCHSGNCASHSGSDWAGKRIATVQEKLKEMGGNPKRLGFVTVAALEPLRFRRIVTEFVQELCQEPEE